MCIRVCVSYRHGYLVTAAVCGADGGDGGSGGAEGAPKQTPQLSWQAIAYFRVVHLRIISRRVANSFWQ